LTITPAPAGRITLAWGSSCTSGDYYYTVYEGILGDFSSHARVECGTGGARTVDVLPRDEDAYYLVVPTNGMREGSYGTASNGVPRQPGADACLPRSHAGCE
jgi:hypothetical protein